MAHRTLPSVRDRCAIGTLASEVDASAGDPAMNVAPGAESARALARVRPKVAGMLTYERRVVDALLSSDDPARRQAVADHVAAELAAKPEVLRAGLVGETVLLSAWSVARRRGQPLRPADELAWLERHPIGLVRQWVRALRSLVLFAEQEMLDADSRPTASSDEAGAASASGPASSDAPALTR